jgi:aryl-alcohol dehydrogenase-like predicted oxidoreductase
VERLRAIGTLYGRSSGELSVAWTLRHSAVPGAILGFRRPEQVEDIIGAGEVPLRDDELGAIEAVVEELWGG